MLNQQQAKRKNELLQIYQTTGHLSQFEAQELKELIEQDTSLDEGVKLLLLFALVAMIIYASRG